jgi:hypothetical protein
MAGRYRGNRRQGFGLWGAAMRLLLSVGVVAVTLGAISSCARRDVTALATRQPALVLEEFFAGDTVAFGIFEDRFGNLRRQFRVALNGAVTGNRLVLNEQFLYEDGEAATRIWTIDNLGPDADGSIRYQGMAADIDGVASGRIAGNGLNWAYDVSLTMGGTATKVHFDDWIYRQSDEIAINRAYVSKFGMEIGSVTIVFLRGKAAAAVMPLNLDKWVAPPIAGSAAQ